MFYFMVTSKGFRMSIDLQLGNMAFVLLQALLTFGALAAILYASSKIRAKSWYKFAFACLAFFMFVSAIIAFSGQGPRLTLDYRQPAVEAHKDSGIKPYQEEPDQPRLDRLRELDAETDERTLGGSDNAD